MPTRKEADLYGPVKQFLEAQGYAVRGEVNDCDLAAVRGEDLVIVELKAAFNLALLLQGVARQKLTDAVYLAIEAPRSQRGAGRWQEIKDVCRRLGLGLLTVAFARKGPIVEVVCEPEPYTPRRSLKGRAKLLKEFKARSADHNTGGVTRRPIVTAYREESLWIAAHLRQHGSSATKAIREATGSARSTMILYDNVYGWFDRVERGVYRLTPKGEKALALYADVVEER